MDVKLFIRCLSRDVGILRWQGEQHRNVAEFSMFGRAEHARPTQLYPNPIMKITMTAPSPFSQPRGTFSSLYQLLLANCLEWPANRLVNLSSWRKRGYPWSHHPWDSKALLHQEHQARIHKGKKFSPSHSFCQSNVLAGFKSTRRYSLS